MITDTYFKGRPKSLTILDYGLFRVFANGRIIGICGYLIQTTADEVILVDTGFPANYARDPAGSSREDGLDAFGEVLNLTGENLPAGQLARLGLSARDIDLLVITHSHIDHVGGIADFSGVPILVAEAERRLERPLYWGDRRPLAWPDAEYQLVTRDFDLCPGLRVLLTPGHAPGQLSLLVELPETGVVLLTGDAISRPAELDGDFSDATDPAQARASAERLMRLARERGAFTIYGHSPEQWPILRKAPEGYV